MLIWESDLFMSDSVELSYTFNTFALHSSALWLSPVASIAVGVVAEVVVRYKGAVLWGGGVGVQGHVVIQCQVMGLGGLKGQSVRVVQVRPARQVTVHVQTALK